MVAAKGFVRFTFKPEANMINCVLKVTGVLDELVAVDLGHAIKG
jgi:hypothetical protein